MERADYDKKKDEVANSIIARLEAFFPGLTENIVYRYVHC